MGKYLKKFDNHAQYEAFIGGGVEAVELYGEFIEPNVSHCVQENHVHYNPKRYYVTCTYSVEDATQPTQLYFYEDYSYPYFGVDKFDIAYIDGKEVSIADLDAAEGKYQLTSGEHTVKFALKDKTEIHEGSFFRCDSLTSITIPSSVTSIGRIAFNSCSNLTNVTIPNSVTSIGHAAFEYTPWWTAYSADTSNQYGNIVYINDVAVKAVSTSITSCEFKEGTVCIADAAFQNCANLLNVSIPNTVTSISDNTFSYCSGLTSITIPNTVTSIGYGAFNGCESLESVNIPNSITSIEGSTFAECYSLTSITIPSSVTSIGQEAFAYCFGLTSITIPNNVTSIGGYAFISCEALTSVTINAITPPIFEEDAFAYTNNCPIYVPSESVDAYKTASGWSEYEDRIQAIPTT